MATKSVTSKDSAPPPDERDSLVADLSPENRVVFRQAKLALVQAEAAYEEAKRAAEEEKGKPERSFEAAKKAHEDAEKKLKDGADSAVNRAQAILDRLAKEAGEMKAARLIETDGPEEGRKQIAKLQGMLDEYKASVTAVAAQKQLVDDALLALQKVSKPQEGKFEAVGAAVNPAAQSIAKEQYALAIAQAEIPLDAAKDAFALKRAELAGSRPRKMH